MSIVDRIKNALNVDDWSERDTEFQSRHAQLGGSDYDRYRPAYQYGYGAALSPEYRGKSFDEVEPTLRSSWAGDDASRVGDWDSVRDYTRDAYSRGQERVLTLSEEELAIGKRQVQAGEVSVSKRVETERVTESVPLTREEVTVERRPVTDGRLADAAIGEDHITVNLTAEEAVVEKRPVVKEEIVVTKHAVQENQTVSADLKRERADIDDTRTTNTSGLRDRTLDDEARDR